MSLCQSPPQYGRICWGSEICSADPGMGKDLKEPVWLWLFLVVSVYFDDFHTWNLKHFLILKEVLHLKNTSIKSSLLVGLVVFTKNGRIYLSSVFNDKPLQEPSFICGLRTASPCILLAFSSSVSQSSSTVSCGNCYIKNLMTEMLFCTGPFRKTTNAVQMCVLKLYL